MVPLIIDDCDHTPPTEAVLSFMDTYDAIALGFLELIDPAVLENGDKESANMRAIRQTEEDYEGESTF